MSQPIVLGFDLGGTALKASVVTADGRIERFVRIASRAGESREGPLLAMTEAAGRLLAPGERVAAIGLGSPGVIEARTGRLVGHTPHLPHGRDLAFGDELTRRFGVPVAVDNDANAAALAEYRCGAGRDARLLVLVTVGTGIGCGIVVDGRPLRGASGGAGELGHIPLGRDGVRCACGVPGCVEPEASGSGLARQASERGWGELDAEAVFARAAGGDAAARELLAGFIDRLGATVATAINVLAPDVVVIGGGVSNAGAALFAPLATAVERYALPTHRRELRLVPAALGDRAGSVGAGLLGWEALGAR